MAINPHRKGGPDVTVSDGGTGASDAATARTNLGAGDLTTAAHGSLDHSAIPGAGLDLRHDFLLPTGFGGGHLLPSEVALSPEGLVGTGALASLTLAAPPSALTYTKGALGLGHAVDWVLGPSTFAHFHSPTQVFGPAMRLTGQFLLSGTPVPTDEVFFGVTTIPTPPATFPLTSTPLAKFGLAFNVALHPTDWVVVADAQPPVATGVPAIGGSIPIMVKMLSPIAPGGAWIIELVDSYSLATLYGPAPFTGLTHAAHGFSLGLTTMAGASYTLSIFGITFG